MEIMLDKKQIQVIFLFEFKMGCKAAETTCSINNAFGSVTANEHTVQWWPKKFCKGGIGKTEIKSPWPHQYSQFGSGLLPNAPHPLQD